jgi:hypothetical protein
MKAQIETIRSGGGTNMARGMQQGLAHYVTRNRARGYDFPLSFF